MWCTIWGPLFHNLILVIYYLKFCSCKSFQGGVVYLGNGNLGSIVDKFHGCLSVIFSIYLGGKLQSSVTVVFYIYSYCINSFVVYVGVCLWWELFVYGVGKSLASIFLCIGKLAEADRTFFVVLNCLNYLAICIFQFEFEGSKLLSFYLHGLLGFQFKVSGSAVGIREGNCSSEVFTLYRFAVLCDRSNFRC